MNISHHPVCDYWFEQYEFECTCGATRPKHPGFDDYVERCREAREYSRKQWSGTHFVNGALVEIVDETEEGTN